MRMDDGFEVGSKVYIHFLLSFSWISIFCLNFMDRMIEMYFLVGSKEYKVINWKLQISLQFLQQNL